MFKTIIIRNSGIRVVTRPHRTLHQEFPSPEFRPPSHLQTNVVYKIPCNDCNWSYIGETGRNTRKKEHIRNVKYCNKGSNVANHAWMNDHQIDFENAIAIDKGDHRVRKTLESWHTAMTTEADNNARSLPRQFYSFKIVFLNSSNSFYCHLIMHFYS